MLCKQWGRQGDAVLNFNLLWSRDVNSHRLCFVNKDGGGVNDLACKPNFDLLLSRDVNSPRLCYVNKDGGGVNDLPCKGNFYLLCSRGVNSPRLLCKQWGRQCDNVLNFNLLIFWNVMVTWCKQPEAMLCKQWGRQCDAVLNLLW
jgi:hypothetical protein